ncbi:MAG: DUF6020 family protein, partial [Bifidobacteriaceae bacterium]|nr:DUF6020 family protein [Bifidobacteriaceae bacterium]
PRPGARRDRARPGNAWRWCLVGLLAVAAITLRRDALYAFLLFTVLAAVLYRPARKALALTFVSASILGLLLDPVLYKGIMGAKEGTSIAAYSVPLQQLARVYSRSPDSLTPEQRQQLESFVEPEALAAYRPQLADPVMVGANADRIAADTKRFVKLWAEIGLAHPAEYVDAALANTVEGWLPGAVIDAYAAPGAGPLNPTAGTSYFCFATEQPGQATPKGPQFIHDLYADFSKYSRTPFEIPVLAWLWSPGTYLWAFAFALAISWSATRRGRPSAFMPVALLLLATCAPIFLGPTMLVRYFLQLFYCAPLLAAFLADPRVCGLPPAQDKVAAQGDSHAAAQTHQSAVERSPRTP